MRDHFRETGDAQGPAPKDAEEKRLWLIKPFMYMCLWVLLFCFFLGGERPPAISTPPSRPPLYPAPRRSPPTITGRGALLSRGFFSTSFREFGGGLERRGADLPPGVVGFFFWWGEKGKEGEGGGGGEGV